MTVTVDGVAQPIPLTTFKLLDDMIAILGSTKASLWPMLESTGSVIRTYEESVHYFTMTDSGALGFYPYRHAGGVHSYHFLKSDDQHGAGEDHGDFEFNGAEGPPATTDLPFSVGAWVWQDVQGAQATILAKYDVAGAAREWQYYVSAANVPTLELYDENANADETGPADTALTLNQWHFVAFTYDGAQDDPGVTFYLDGAADGTGTTETGAYVAMQSSATPLMLGAADDTAAPTNEFNGRIALPFITGAELAAADIAALYGIGARLLGIKS